MNKVVIGKDFECYGDEMFVRYNSVNDTFVPCGGIIGRKVKSVSVAIG